VVVCYNDVLARMRRASRYPEEASMDLGATQLQLAIGHPGIERE